MEILTGHGISGTGRSLTPNPRLEPHLAVPKTRHQEGPAGAVVSPSPSPYGSVGHAEGKEGEESPLGQRPPWAWSLAVDGGQPSVTSTLGCLCVCEQTHAAVPRSQWNSGLRQGQENTAMAPLEPLQCSSGIQEGQVKQAGSGMGCEHTEPPG